MLAINGFYLQPIRTRKFKTYIEILKTKMRELPKINRKVNYTMNLCSTEMELKDW